MPLQYLSVPAHQQVGAGGEQDHRPQAEDAEPLPGRQHVSGLLAGLRDHLAGDRRQVPVDVVGDRARDQRDQRRHDEDQADHGGDRADHVPDEAADGEREQAEDGQVEHPADARAGDARLAERDRYVAAQDRGADEEHREHGDRAGHEVDGGEHRGLGGQHRQPFRHREQRRADRPGRVLAADHDHAEHADGELAEAEPGAEDQRGRVRDERDVVGVVARGVPLPGHDARDQRAEADRQEHEREERPQGGPNGADLRPLGGEQAGRHGVPALPYSTLSAVSSMNASSSEGSWGVSSCSTSASDAASSPMRGAGSPVTTMAPSPVPLPVPLPSRTVPPSASMSSRSRAWAGVRTSTERSELRWMNSWVEVSAISRPRPITTRRSAVTAISLIRWLDTKTVRPLAASSRMKLRTQRMPSGSSPLPGSSSSSTGGSPSIAAARPSRCVMPSEKPPARLRATSSSPTRSSTSSTRRAGMSWVWARNSRWSRALRPGCRLRASSSAPTTVSGLTSWA